MPSWRTSLRFASGSLHISRWICALRESAFYIDNDPEPIEPVASMAKWLWWLLWFSLLSTLSLNLTLRRLLGQHSYDWSSWIDVGTLRWEKLQSPMQLPLVQTFCCPFFEIESMIWDGLVLRYENMTDKIYKTLKMYKMNRLKGINCLIRSHNHHIDFTTNEW